jgi:hypothetical protein
LEVVAALRFMSSKPVPEVLVLSTRRTVPVNPETVDFTVAVGSEAWVL